MAAENATETLTHLRAQWLVDEGKQAKALAELQEHLGLQSPPNRIECYDISTTQGTATTGSMVVFVKGVPRKSDYRSFQIRTVEGTDDYASMREMLRRRFRRVTDPAAHRPSRMHRAARKSSWDLLPDLLVVDGGKGQLNVALEVLDEYRPARPGAGWSAWPSRRRRSLCPTGPIRCRLPRTSEGLYLMQRVRDEAHRFAITYHRRVRPKQTIISQLDGVPGIGPKRRSALLKHFGSIDAIRAASVEELAAVPGMTRKAAEQLKGSL